MIRGRVLVIDGDEWLSLALARALLSAGYQVDVCTSARDGFTRACESPPDCIVSALDLPDIDGYWLARRVRAEHGPVATVPLLVLADAEHGPCRAQALKAGADAVLDRPIANDEVVAQIEAFLALARRFGADLHLEEDEGAAGGARNGAAAIRGDLSMFPVASVLMMFEMERRSGVVEVATIAGTKAKLTIHDGLFAATSMDDRDVAPVDVLRAVLSWRAGSFSFLTKDPKTLPPPRASVGAMMLEAMRLEDEINERAVALDDDELEAAE